ncbi:MAG TPA: ATP-binding cassette domain-containing protein [Gemmatimonadales bacterium]|jgi:simple sugar transport system ATP-binding protein
MISLALERISKQFGSLTALDHVSLDVVGGEVHALLGENGAGKSTLIRIVYGMERADGGAVTVHAASDYHGSGFRSPRAARGTGVGMVHQHFTSIATLTVVENIALFAGWREAGVAARRRAEAVVARAGLPLPMEQVAGELSVQLRQRLEIVQALAADARILLLDEPTAVLAPREVVALLEFLRSFAAAGNAVVLITHKLDEVLQVADRVTVLRRGVVTWSAPVGDATVATLARAMIGTDLPLAEHTPATPGSVVARADGLTLGRSAIAAVERRIVAIEGASFAWRAGELVGIAAIDGNGQHELLRALAGVGDVARLGGRLEVSGPIALIPEDRTTEAVIPAFTVAENLLFATLGSRAFLIDWPAVQREAQALAVGHDVRPSDSDVAMASLSGGNQQKFVVARALAAQPRVVVAEDPTRGLDVLATAAIHAQLRAAARAGALVVVHSSDLDEVLLLADRLVVVVRGRVVELPRGATRDQVGDAMLGVGVPA